MTDRILDRELKKGSAELMILALARGAAAPRLRDQPDHRAALRRRRALQGGVALSPALSPRAPRLDRRAVGREGRSAPSPLLPAHARRAARYSPSSARAGSGSSPPSTASRRSAMPDFHAELKRRLAGRGIDPTRHFSVIEELAQHLDDRYRSLIAQGSSRRGRRAQRARGARRWRCAGTRAAAR